MLRVEQMKKRLATRTLSLVAKGAGVSYDRLLRFMRNESSYPYVDAQKVSDFLESEDNDNAA